jgi:hypothetical protein
MVDIDGISYGAFIIPGLVMLTLLMQSISNASFGIYMPKFSGTIYEVLSAPISYVEIVLGYVGAAATKSVNMGLMILMTATKKRKPRKRMALPIMLEEANSSMTHLIEKKRNCLLSPKKRKRSSTQHLHPIPAMTS